MDTCWICCRIWGRRTYPKGSCQVSCHPVSSRMCVKPRRCRAVSSQPRVHARRAVLCQIAACPRVRVLSAPSCKAKHELVRWQLIHAWPVKLPTLQIPWLGCSWRHINATSGCLAQIRPGADMLRKKHVIPCNIENNLSFSLLFPKQCLH